MEATLRSLAERLRGDQEGDISTGLSELAEALSNCDEEGEEALVALVDESQCLPPLIAKLNEGVEDDHVLYLGLSTLVNLADVGGAELVLRHGGFELLLSLVDSADLSAKYYACAGIQNLTSDAFIVSAFVDDLGSALDEADSKLTALTQEPVTEDTEHIARCAAGALANIQAVPAASEYTASVTPSPSEKSGNDGSQTEDDPRSSAEPSESLEQKLSRAVQARMAYERQMAHMQHNAAAVVQRAIRERFARSLSGNHLTVRSGIAAAADEAQRERVTAASKRAAQALVAPREPAADWHKEVETAVMTLARLLTDAVGEESEAHAVGAVRDAGLLGPLTLLLVEQLHSDDKRLLYLGLSVVVNLADLGGADLVHAHGGLDLLIGLLRAEDLSVRYYAVAGVQNLTSTPDCASRVRGTGVEHLLEAMLECGHAELERCAAGALANIRRSSRVLRSKAAAAADRDGADAARAPAAAAAGSATPPGAKRPAPLISVAKPTARNLHTAAAERSSSAQPQAAGGGAQPQPAAGRGLGAFAALPMGGLGLLYTVVTLPLRPFFRTAARPAEKAGGGVG